MNVARILKDKGRMVVTASPDTSMKDAVHLLAEKKIGALVVCEADRRIKGVISERDVIGALAAHGAAALDAPIAHFMTTSVVTCTEHDTVDWLMEEMTAKRFRHIPAVESGRLVGIVSIGDVVKLRVAQCEMEAASMREYIATG